MRRSFQRLIPCLSVLALACGAPPESPPSVGPAIGTWTPLFNGKNLDGWRAKIKGYELDDNFADTFRVEDGILKVVYGGEYESYDQRFGHLFFETPFSHYRLRVEYRFVGEQVPGGPGWAFRNNGMMLHGQSAESMELDQDFPVSIEAQLLGGRADGERSTGNLCTPGTNVVMGDELKLNHCINSSSVTCRGDEWVTFEVEVRGNESIRHFINGELVLEYTNPQLDDRDGDAQRLLAAGAEKMLSRGTISLQAESHPTDFRRIDIMLLEGNH
ncbi:MAG: hypothetical protein ACI8QC_002934 [Planctomycetota bacterium]|jgi:hypothetical protein